MASGIYLFGYFDQQGDAAATVGMITMQIQQILLLQSVGILCASLLSFCL